MGIFGWVNAWIEENLRERFSFSECVNLPHFCVIAIIPRFFPISQKIGFAWNSKKFAWISNIILCECVKFGFPGGLIIGYENSFHLESIKLKYLTFPLNRLNVIKKLMHVAVFCLWKFSWFLCAVYNNPIRSNKKGKYLVQ